MATLGRVSPKQARVLAALLGGACVAEAAATAHAGERTVRRWMADKSFRAALQEAQGESLRLAGVHLAELMRKAARVADSDLDSGDARLRQRTELALLARYSDLLEVLDLGQRVTLLEDEKKG